MKNQEIERKFLVNTPLEIDITQYRGKTITQGYVLSGDIKINETESAIIANGNHISLSSEQLNKLIEFNPFGKIDLEKDTFRLRQLTYPDDKIVNVITLKSPSSNRGFSRTEVECEISKEQFDTLFPLCENNIVKKIRYNIELEEIENTVLELDIFLGKHTGLVLAEFEFESLAEANKFVVPSILDCVEVTGDKKYTNLELSKA